MAARAASPVVTERRQAVEAALDALERPPSGRRVPPPEGRLGAGEGRIGHLRSAVEQLGPVFTDFARYLSTRVDLLPRRDCIELAAVNGHAGLRAPIDAAALVIEQLGDAPGRRFFSIDPEPVAITRWHQRHDAWLASGDPVSIIIVRPDAGQLLDTDLPLLARLSPWLDLAEKDITAAIEDFSRTLTERLDQSTQAARLELLAEDAHAGGLLRAPRCYRDYCARGILTVERLEGVPLAEAIATGSQSPIDRADVARRLACAWLRQAVTGRVVPFDFDLHDVWLDEGTLLLAGGALEPMPAGEGRSLLAYLVATAADEPDRALAWIHAGIESDAPLDSLRRRLRQAVPFRDGEWSGDDRVAEHALVHWRAARETGATMTAHHLHIYRGVHAIATATTTLSAGDDALMAALQSERIRLAGIEAQRLLGASSPLALETLVADLVDLPRRLDQVLTQASEGHLRVQVQMPDDEDRRTARNRTVSLVASLVTLVAITFLARHVAPGAGTAIDALVALAVLVVGGWLLASASRL